MTAFGLICNRRVWYRNITAIVLIWNEIALIMSLYHKHDWMSLWSYACVLILFGLLVHKEEEYQLARLWLDIDRLNDRYQHETVYLWTKFNWRTKCPN